jgi:hypothetical protein
VGWAGKGWGGGGTGPGGGRGGGTGGEGEEGGPILEHLKKIRIFLKMFLGTSQCPKGTGTH